MSFQSLVIGANTFSERTRGVYVNSSVVLGSASDEIRLKPNTNPKQPNVSITRYRHVVVPATATLPERRVPVVAVLQLTVPPNEPAITATILNSLVQDLAAVSSVGNLNRLFTGES